MFLTGRKTGSVTLYKKSATMWTTGLVRVHDLKGDQPRQDRHGDQDVDVQPDDGIN